MLIVGGRSLADRDCSFVIHNAVSVSYLIQGSPQEAPHRAPNGFFSLTGGTHMQLPNEVPTATQSGCIDLTHTIGLPWTHHRTLHHTCYYTLPKMYSNIMKPYVFYKGANRPTWLGGLFSKTVFPMHLTCPWQSFQCFHNLQRIIPL